jgi:tetratricopeptide (TPR) repeat protein
MRQVVAFLACALLPATLGAVERPVTFSKDIAPILFAKCSACHHPEGAAPFSVLTFAAARPFATQIAAATARGFMPPWSADPGFGGPFVGQSHLTPAERDLIGQWVAEGAREGEPRDLPPTPRWTSGWHFGPPDLVVTPPAYTLQPEGADVFRVFVMALPVDSAKFVRGLEFLPGNPKVVHHANIRVDPTPTSRGFDAADPAPGYDGLIARSALYPDGHFLGWTPGQVAPLLPKGLAWRLVPGTDLVVELHMQPSGKTELVQPSIGLYFGPDAPAQTPAMLRLGRQSIDIRPGDSHYAVTDSFVLPVDVEVQAVQPHAHHRAKDVSGIATLPDGTVRPLIHIADWDFRWQHVYRYETPLALPKGTTLSMRYVYDNSADNPRNPDQSPRRVFWGQRSGDEMGDLWIQMLTRDDRDLRTLNNQIGPKVVAEDVVGYERWMQTDPNPALHDDVAVLYLQLQRPDDAVRHFGISAGLQPESPAAHFNLGTALTLAGRLDTAVSQYRRALELRPDYVQAHNNLGSVLLRTGRFDEALPHLAEAVRLDPSNAQAQYNSGVAMRERGRLPEAMGYFRRALTLNADMAGALADLAWLLAAASDDRLRDPPTAVGLAERAVELTERRDPIALDILAAAYASAGRYPRAVEAADAALNLKPANAEEIAARRALYDRRQPYRLPAP